MCTYKNGQIYALSQSYLVCLNNVLEYGKNCISSRPVCTNGRTDLSPKEGWACWKQDSKDEDLPHMHPVRTSNLEKTIVEIPGKTYLSDFFLYDWVSVVWTNETVLQGCVVFFGVFF